MSYSSERTRLLNINLATRFRDPNSTVSQPVWTLNRTLQKIHFIRVKTVTIPISYYVFTSANNTFVNTHSVAGAATITIPPGTYDYSTLASTLSTLLANGGITYTVAISNTTGILTVTASSGTFTWTLGPGSPGYQLGFGSATSASSVLTVLTSPYVVQLSGPKRLYLQIDNLPIDSPVVTAPSNILLAIPVSVPFLDILQYGNYEQQELEYYIPACGPSVTNLNKISLSLVDSNSNLIDLNGSDWEITLECQYEPL